MSARSSLKPDQALASWFREASRDFPWRRRRDAYTTLVAETMLHQTRAHVVVGYFERWLDLFPTLSDLARASERDVLAAWEGLGYYARARRLHAAAQIVVDRHGGRIPSTEAELRELPGVGPYAAAAIAAFAFGARTVAVDGNVRRVGARLLGDPNPSDATVRTRLDALLTADEPSVGTEALIELGATVCTPRRPRCTSCPILAVCTAHREGTQEVVPAKKPKRRVTRRIAYAWVVVRAADVWLVRREQDGLLGGLWGVPQREDAPDGATLDPIRHAYSHIDLTVVPVVARHGAPPPPSTTEVEGRWVQVDSVAAYPCSRVDRKILDAVRRAGLLG